jgi:hypothetical protein
MQAVSRHKALDVLSAFPSRDFRWDFSVELLHGSSRSYPHWKRLIPRTLASLIRDFSVRKTKNHGYPQDFSVTY